MANTRAENIAAGQQALAAGEISQTQLDQAVLSNDFSGIPGTTTVPGQAYAGPNSVAPTTPRSAYVPIPGAATGSQGSHKVGGVELVPSAEGYSQEAAIPYLQSLLAPYNADVANYLQSIGQLDAATQSKIAAVNASKARTEEILAQVNSGAMSSAEAEQLMKQADASLNYKLNILGSDLVDSGSDNKIVDTTPFSDSGSVSSSSSTGGLISSGADVAKINKVKVGGVVYGPDGTEYQSVTDAMSAGVFNYNYFPPSTTSPKASEPLKAFDMATRNNG